MLFDTPLARIFGNGISRVLDALFASDALTIRQVARVADIAPGTAATALARLEEQRLVRSKPVGSALQYWVNDQHHAVPALRQLVEEGRQLEGKLPGLILSILGSHPRSVVAFGSTARSGPRAARDLDLLVIAHNEQELERWEKRVDNLGEALALQVGGPLDVLMLAPPKPADLRRPFWREVVRDGIVIDGESLESR